ncbi:hypothetical protein BDV12DRAFT_53321 [Aspergillus spectabilis]
MAFTKSIASAGLLALYAMQLTPSVLADAVTCANDTPLSCSSSTIEPSCCFSNPGGAFLLTQFWDYDPSIGPSDSWTIHGLWPDNCDGTYEEFCDESRQYSNITAIIEESGRTKLLSYMNEYWKDYSGDDESLWSHEWNKHGTCMNTLEPNCYTDYKPQEEVVDYLQKAVDLFKTLDSYKALAAANITPSTSKTYTLSEVHNALANIHDGFAPYVACDGDNLNEVWYFYYLRGNVANGLYDPSEKLTESNCPETGIKYMPKTGGEPSAIPTSTPTSTPTFPPTASPSHCKGH